MLYISFNVNLNRKNIDFYKIFSFAHLVKILK